MIALDELERLAKAATPGPSCDRGFGSIQPESGGSLVAVTVTKGGCLPAVRSDCVITKYSLDKDGYGSTRRNNKFILAHRLAYIEANGLKIEDIAGKIVRHKCDNPPCVNPLHLELGSSADNYRDMVERGRRNLISRKGESQATAKLTRENVLEIRRRYTARDPINSGHALAREFGVSESLIRQIINRLLWRHI